MSGIVSFGRRRSTKVAGAALCVATSAVPAVWGSGVTPSEVELLEGVAWLASEVTGDVVRVNGETGRVDARVPLGEASGELDVEQSGGSVLVRVGDEVRSIDVADLDWGAAAPAAGGLVVADGVAYMVDLEGAVQALDPVTLETMGEVALDAAPESVTVSGDRLVAALGDGTVKVVDRSEVVADLDVGSPDDRLGVSAVGEEVAVLNMSDGELHRVDPASGRAKDPVDVELPRGQLLVPAELPGGQLWMLAVRTGQLVGVDLGSGATETLAVAEPRSDLAGPVALDGHVYLVDRTARTIVDVDTKPLEVKRREPLAVDDASRVEVIAEGGKVFVNDPASELAVVIDGEQFRQVDKYRDEGVAEATPDDLPPPTPSDPAPAETPAPPTPAPPEPAPPAPDSIPPAPPGSVEAVPGNRAATVSWTPGAGGGAVTTWHVAERGGGRAVEVPGGQLSVEIDGLRNGQSYVFEVWASNAAGESTRVASNPVEPNDEVPGAPGNVRAEGRDGAAHVTWSRADGRGNDIAGYVVTSEPGGITRQVQGDGTQADIGGLTNGTAYTFTVRAVNGLGNQGQPSAPSNPVTPYGPPGEIQAEVTNGNGTADVTWTPAENLSPSPVTYEVSVTPTPGGGATASTLGTSHRVTGMQNGVTYTITITPTNDRGAGPSTSAELRPGAPPSVSNVAATSTGERDFRITWAANDGGRPYTGCRISWSGGEAGCDAASGSSTVQVGQYGTQYTFTVTVHNELGEGSGQATGTSAQKGLVVEANAQRWDGACTWPGHEGQRPIYSGARHDCGTEIGWVNQGVTVRAQCYTEGMQIQDDNFVSSNIWIRMDRGYMSTLYFEGYQNTGNVISGMRHC